MSRLALQILWPAFLMAGVLEIAVFALVDPNDLHGLSGAPLEVSRQAVYTVAFLVFWAVIAVASAITVLLTRPAEPADDVRGAQR